MGNNVFCPAEGQTGRQKSERPAGGWNIISKLFKDQNWKTETGSNSDKIIWTLTSTRSFSCISQTSSVIDTWSYDIGCIQNHPPGHSFTSFILIDPLSWALNRDLGLTDHHHVVSLNCPWNFWGYYKVNRFKNYTVIKWPTANVGNYIVNMKWWEIQ